MNSVDVFICLISVPYPLLLPPSRLFLKCIDDRHINTDPHTRTNKQKSLGITFLSAIHQQFKFNQRLKNYTPFKKTVEIEVVIYSLYSAQFLTNEYLNVYKRRAKHPCEIRAMQPVKVFHWMKWMRSKVERMNTDTDTHALAREYLPLHLLHDPQPNGFSICIIAIVHIGKTSESSFSFWASANTMKWSSEYDSFFRLWANCIFRQYAMLSHKKMNA